MVVVVVDWLLLRYCPVPPLTVSDELAVQLTEPPLVAVIEPAGRLRGK